MAKYSINMKFCFQTKSPNWLTTKAYITKVKPLYSGHHRDLEKCLLLGGVRNIEV